MATIGTASRIGRQSFAKNQLVMQIASLEVRQMIKPASVRVMRNGRRRPANPVRRRLFDDGDSDRQLELFEVPQQFELFAKPRRRPPGPDGHNAASGNYRTKYSVSHYLAQGSEKLEGLAR
jgi:hypothetical protein